MAKELSKQELLNQIEETASKCERASGGCGRCCLTTVMQHLKLADDPTIELFRKAAFPLSGGIAQEKETCGALLGGLMAIGIAFFSGKVEDSDHNDRMELLKLGRQYYRGFEKEIGHVRCYDIREVALGRVFDTVDPDEFTRFDAAGGHEKLCPSVVSKAARLAAEFILDIQQQRKG